MGVYNFFIDLKLEERYIDMLKQEYQNSDIYQKAFHFNQLSNDIYTDYNAGISSVLDNFLPSNHLIYKFLCSCNCKKIYIRTNEIERLFDFETKSDFISFMYTSWEKKLDCAYHECGTFMIDVKKYRIVRNRLYKKYYVNF